MMRFPIILCSVITLIISCSGFISVEETEPNTFKNVKVHLISQVHKTSFTVFIEEAKNLRDFIISNKTDTLRVNGQEIPMLYEKSVTDISNVAVYDFSANEIQGIEEGAFGNLGYVQALNLSSNSIRVIRSEVFTNVDVRFLFLSHNKIYKIEEGAFKNLDHLYFIDLSYNRIRNWNWSWFEGTAVKGINMRHNLSELLPEDSFKFSDDLQLSHHQRIFHHILFGHNNLKSIDTFALPKLKRLLHFDSSYNYSRTIEVGTFNNVEILDHLDLSYNDLMYLDRELSKFTEVGYVNLKSNYSFFINTDFIPMVNLDMNPSKLQTKHRWLEWKKKYGVILESPEYSS